VLKEERQAYILHQVNLHNKVLSSHLSEQMQVSEDTIRRDLHELAQDGKVTKVYGGAISNSFHVGITSKDAKERWVTTFERDYILQMLRRNNGNISHAARHADIDRKYFRKLMKKYDIEAAGGDDDDAAE